VGITVGDGQNKKKKRKKGGAPSEPASETGSEQGKRGRCRKAPPHEERGRNYDG